MKSPKNYIPKKVSILGAARSGLAAARFLNARGVSVFISDSCLPNKLSEMLAKGNCSHFTNEAGGHSEKVLDADVIVLSPGVRSNLPILLKAKELGIPVWSEIELAFRFSAAKYLAITGSTGKSTTVSMLGSILEAANAEYVVAGNIGVPLVDVATGIGPDGFVVAEISSFQLENIDCFRPKVGVILNLLKNHLDRYDNEEAYYDAKKIIAQNSGLDDYIVLNADDIRLKQWAETIKNKTNVLWFGNESIPADGAWYKDGAIYSRLNGEVERLLEVESMKLRGLHNYENASAAAIAAKLAGVDNKYIAAGLANFSGLEHRLEFVDEINNVKYYNDSKSTTAESITCAVSAFDHNVHLIAGGRDKGCDFSVVNDALKKYVKDICLIGEAAARMAGLWNGCAPVKTAESLEEAINYCALKAVAGDVVVFSPGCSSFDMFKNFEHRGEVFKRIVCQLRKDKADRSER
jgi:UDP-N-acetylmuramoylalanine--D-glutamate ligase